MSALRMTRQGVRDLNALPSRRADAAFSDDAKRFAGILPRCHHPTSHMEERYRYDPDGYEYRTAVPVCDHCGDSLW